MLGSKVRPLPVCIATWARHTLCIDGSSKTTTPFPPQVAASLISEYLNTDGLNILHTDPLHHPLGGRQRVSTRSGESSPEAERLRDHLRLNMLLARERRRGRAEGL